MAIESAIRVSRSHTGVCPCAVLVALLVFVLSFAQVSLAQAGERFSSEEWVDGGIQASVSNAQPWSVSTPTFTPTSTPTSTLTATPTLTSTHTALPEMTDTPTPSATSTPVSTETPTPTATPSNTPAVRLGDFRRADGTFDSIVDLISIIGGAAVGNQIGILSPLSQEQLAAITLPAVVADAAPVIAPSEGRNTLAAAWNNRSKKQFVFARFDLETQRALEAVSVPNTISKIPITDAVVGCRFPNFALQAITTNQARGVAFVYREDLKVAPRRVRVGVGSNIRCAADRDGNVSSLMAWQFNRKRGTIGIRGWNSQAAAPIFSAPSPRGAFSKYFPFTVPAGATSPQAGFLALDRKTKIYTLYSYDTAARTWRTLEVPGLSANAPVTGVRVGWMADNQTAWAAILLRTGGYLLVTWRLGGV